MNKISLFKNLPLLFTLISFASFAEVPKIIFEENKNQYPAQVLYQAGIKGGSVFLEKNAFTYLFRENDVTSEHESHTAKPVKVNFHSFKVNFRNSNPEVEVSGNNLLEGCRNYYLGNDPKKYAENVKLYSEVDYKGLYPQVDMKVYNTEENLKYDFIIHPGGEVKNIKLNYTGPDEMHLEYGHLYIKTSVGLIIEQKPYAYQETGGIKTQIPCSYALKNNTLSFETGEYDQSLPLVIDPTLIASTYTGSRVDNRGYTATYDDKGNMYTGGTASAQGYPFPIIIGQWDTTYNGGNWDIVLSKFNATGTKLLFSTYYGGKGEEQPHSIIVNHNNELYVVGRTNSIDFPTTAGVFQSGLKGGYDIIIGKFNSTGGLLASTYIGGTSNDCVNVSAGTTPWAPLKYTWGDDGRSEIILDANSNVYVAANTQSTDFPTSAGAYDKVLSGPQDAVVFKMNSNLTSLLYSTYFGGSDYDAAYGLKLDINNKIYVTGGTASSDFPIPTGNVIQPTYGGSVDGFIAVFDPSLSGAAQLLRSTYLGTNKYDQSFLLEIDVSGDLYVYGQTAGNYLVTPGVYSNPKSGMFIHKLRGNLSSTVFSTVIGSGANKVNLSPTAFLVDSCQTIYLSGWGRCDGDTSIWGFPNPSQTSTTGMQVTTNAYQKTTDGCDFYFAVLAPDAKALWYATFLGENDPTGVHIPDHVDGGTSRFDKRGVIYESVCASCDGRDAFPTFPKPGPGIIPAYSNHNLAATGSKCNNGVLKMEVGVNPKAVASVKASGNICAPFKVCFDNTGSSANNFIWDFGDGSSSFAPSPCYTYSFGGTYTVTLYAIDTIGVCGYIDTARVVIKVGAKPSIGATATNISCAVSGLGSATVTVTPNGAMLPLSYKWLPSGGSAQTASGLAAGTYSVTVTDAVGCPNTTTVSVVAPPILTVTTSATIATCGFSNGSATATPAGGTPPYSYVWNPGGNTSPSLSGVATGTYSVLVTDAKGCPKSQTVNVPQNNKDLFVKAFPLNPILCHGDHTGSATAISSTTTTLTYAWSTVPVQTTQTATGLGAGTHTVVITNGTGCKGDTTITILEPEALSTTVYSTDVKCSGGKTGTATATTVGGTGPYTYHWVTNPVQTTATATGFAADTYTVLVSDANNCTMPKSFIISEPAMALTVNTATSGSSCGSIGKGIITSNASNGTAPYSYLWSNGQTSPTISNLLAGTYTLTVTDANGCKQVSTPTVPANTKPLADFTSVTSISCDGVYIKFKDASANAITWNWTFGNTGSSTLQNPTFIFPYNGTYTVTLAVTNPPCMDTVSKPINITDRPDYFSMAETNVFTPNGDNDNNCFLPYFIAGPGADTLNLKACAELEVFDRWGVKMFESAGTDNCWDGNNRKDKKPAPDGTYFYIAKLGKTTSKGYVTLLRHK